LPIGQEKRELKLLGRRFNQLLVCKTKNEKSSRLFFTRGKLCSKSALALSGADEFLLLLMRLKVLVKRMSVVDWTSRE
jgi:hypothetical protein